MRVLMQRPEQIKVSRITFKMLAGTVGCVAIFDMRRDLLPGPPVVGVVATLDLVSRRGRAPKKTRGELSTDHGCWATIARIIPRIISARTRKKTRPIGPTTAATARPVDIA